MEPMEKQNNKYDAELFQEFEQTHFTVALVMRSSIDDFIKICDFIENTLTDTSLIYRRKALGKLYITHADPGPRRRYT